MKKTELLLFFILFTGILNAQVNTMTMGTNFWNIEWTNTISGKENFFKEGVNWQNPQMENVWNKTFLRKLTCIAPSVLWTG